LSGFFPVAVADVLEKTTLILQLEVIPILAANEGTAIAITKLEIVHTLENLGEGLALLEVQTTIVAGLGKAGTAVVDADQIPVPVRHGPAGTDGHRRVELPFDLADIEAHGVSRGGSAQRYGES